MNKKAKPEKNSDSILIYEDSTEFITDQLERLDLMIELALERFEFQDDVDSGYTLRRDDIRQLLGQGKSENDIKMNKVELKKILDDKSFYVHERINKTKAAGGKNRIARICNFLSLEAITLDIFIICMAPSIDTKYKRIYAYLQNESLRKYPTVELIYKLLDIDYKQRAVIHKSLSRFKPLMFWQVIELSERKKNDKDPDSFLSIPMHFDERLITYMYGDDEIDSRFLEVVEIYSLDDYKKEFFYSDELKKKCAAMIEIVKPNHEMKNTILYFLGHSKLSKFKTADFIANNFNNGLLPIDSEKLLHEELKGKGLIKLLIREMLLSEAVLYFDNFEVFLSDDPVVIEIRKSLMEFLQQYAWLCFIDSTEPYYGIEKMSLFNFDIPDYAMRCRIWEHYLKDTKHTVNIQQLSARFKLPEERIIDAIDLAERNSLINNDFENELYNACKQVSGKNLMKLAKKIEHKFTIEDLILPDDKIQQLETMITFSRNMHILYGKRGFGDLLPYGRGLTVLFSGQSGTGKTMAAGIMGNLLNLDVYRIDLATVVDKYIGETEKNLKRIFHEASYSNAILFFDEADALFGKRSEVRDAHDRFANIEISYLLQLMDEYEGITILATNLRSNIDKSFNRRFKFIIEFPLPEVECRNRLWRAVFPKKLALANDIDYDFLAKRIEFTGADIKAMALMAGMYAEKEGEEVVTMRHVMLGVKTEYKRLGRSFYEHDFRPYYALTIKEEE